VKLIGAAAATDAGSRQEPELVNVTFNKFNNSLGLSIVASKVVCCLVECTDHCSQLYTSIMKLSMPHISGATSY